MAFNLWSDKMKIVCLNYIVCLLIRLVPIIILVISYIMCLCTCHYFLSCVRYSMFGAVLKLNSCIWIVTKTVYLFRYLTQLCGITCRTELSKIGIGIIGVWIFRKLDIATVFKQLKLISNLPNPLPDYVRPIEARLELLSSTSLERRL